MIFDSRSQERVAVMRTRHSCIEPRHTSHGVASTTHITPHSNSLSLTRTRTHPMHSHTPTETPREGPQEHQGGRVRVCGDGRVGRRGATVGHADTAGDCDEDAGARSRLWHGHHTAVSDCRTCEGMLGDVWGGGYCACECSHRLVELERHVE